ncbi:MAG: response regulator [Bdellovibrio sp.]|nr:response regulator [Bdellovibrio sp.]
MKPIIIYVDDEPMNLTVLEAALPSEWDIRTFDSPLKALDMLSQIDPWIVISDQKMPGMNGVSFLEIVKKTNPHALRVLVTGYSDEDLVVDSVRKARISDYIRKPWDVDDLEHRVRKLVDTYLLEKENREKSALLEKQNIELNKALKVAEDSKTREEKFRKELECWAPPFILNMFEAGEKNYPCTKDLAVITYDIIKSSELHDKSFNNISIRSLILRGFTEILLKSGAWRESHSGDSAFGHIGLFKDVPNSCDILMSVASEFRVFLRNLSLQSNIQFECGIGLHYAKDCLVDIHEVNIDYFGQKLTQKSFDATSSGIDLVHRIEKVAHDFPGSNVMMTKDFYERITMGKNMVQSLGSFAFKGQASETEVFARLSDQATEQIKRKLKVA